MAEAKRIKATPVVPPDVIQLTLTIEEAAHVAAILGQSGTRAGIPAQVYFQIEDLLRPTEQIHFRDQYRMDGSTIRGKESI